MPAVTQTWTHEISMMQQSVLLAAIRGPDGTPKYGPCKMMLRWFRRCVLLSAIDGKVLDDPISPNGGSFTGPSTNSFIRLTPAVPWEVDMNIVVDDYLRELDALPHHFQLHFLHAIEILGYKHPDDRIRGWWNRAYQRLVKDMHLHPETMEELDFRLGDNREQWLATADHATRA